MKHSRFLAWLLVLCLCLTACTEKTAAGDSTPTAGSAAPSIPTVTKGPSRLDKSVDFELGGKIRVHYTVNMSAARYIDSPEKLPDYAELKQYNADWFRDHALLLVYETVRSSSLQVGIESILLEDGQARIKLSHTPGDTVGTTVPTTWLLWAEVDAGMNCTWNVENPAEKSETADR